MSTKDEYVAKLKTQLDEWSTDIDALEVKAHLAKAEFSDKYAEQLTDLKAKRDEAAVKIAEVQDAAGDAWVELKKGGEEAWGSIVKAVAEARKKFTDDA
jgi:chromosome segregation ATPase